MIFSYIKNFPTPMNSSNNDKFSCNAPYITQLWNKLKLDFQAKTIDKAKKLNAQIGH